MEWHSSVHGEIYRCSLLNMQGSLLTLSFWLSLERPFVIPAVHTASLALYSHFPWFYIRKPGMMGHDYSERFNLNIRGIGGFRRLVWFRLLLPSFGTTHTHTPSSGSNAADPIHTTPTSSSCRCPGTWALSNRERCRGGKGKGILQRDAVRYLLSF